MPSPLRLIALIAVVLATPAWTQTYPDKTKPLKIVVPFGAGSGTDLLARALGIAITEKSGVAVVVDNRPGAEGVIGMSAAKNSPPDGYTMVIANTGTQVLNVFMQSDLPYDPVADFVPIAGLAKFTNILNATSSAPYRTANEFIEAAKKSPGKFRFGSATAYTRLEMELLEKIAGLELLQIPYKSMAEATTALVRGEVDVLMTDAATAIPFYESGRIRPLGVTGTARMVGLPNIPTLKEQGLEYDFTGWIAMYFPARTPAAAVATMRELLKESGKSPRVIEVMARASYEPLNLYGDQLTILQRTDAAKLAPVVRASSRSAR